MTRRRVRLYFIGVALGITAFWLLFFQAGLNRWIPVGLAVVAVVLVAGVSIMHFADSGREPPVDPGFDVKQGRGERRVEPGDHGRAHH